MCNALAVYDDLFDVEDDVLLGDAFTRDAVDLLMQAAMAVNAAGGSARIRSNEETEDLALSEIDDA
ncbi:hypothetical protein A6M27_15215 [Acidithiobacillus thiooxidans]|jgi:hypothetical protein|uniref:Uncharacterized protein n=2 Tax=Acidithiobacillus TaxID=119977 RepID=A0A1C2I6K2_ACITH|nr:MULTISPECIES: hypothetical protein [Acidithiobacillus]MBU2761673.1 hypothetical protein [Acidithiobacillus sulfurivorans]MDA8175721.1 hypothetical protein [Acidithiobacillus sp.]OCX70684.1 hypothetical protein A6O24_16270 [Acidithiobacillus thiooxidans]OCX71631.1 hypothetical protein A6P07_11580 [Acidithiobacillus thiooxidans]OCX74704.1 hypothetical protein A6M23_05255 [Acidithiobacillus thiooxidans]